MKKNVVHVIKSQLPGETKIDSFKVWPLNNHAKAKNILIKLYPRFKLK